MIQEEEKQDVLMKSDEETDETQLKPRIQKTVSRSTKKKPEREVVHCCTCCKCVIKLEETMFCMDCQIVENRQEMQIIHHLYEYECNECDLGHQSAKETIIRKWIDATNGLCGANLKNMGND